MKEDIIIRVISETDITLMGTENDGISFPHLSWIRLEGRIGDPFK